MQAQGECINPTLKGFHSYLGRHYKSTMVSVGTDREDERERETNIHKHHTLHRTNMTGCYNCNAEKLCICFLAMLFRLGMQVDRVLCVAAPLNGVCTFRAGHIDYVIYNQWCCSDSLIL